MNTVFWFGVRSFVLALILTPICRDIFRSFGVVDRPDKSRKVHAYPIPRVGGIAIVISYFAAFYLWRPDDPSFTQLLGLVERLIPAASVIFAVGLIDDFFGLKPWQKLLGQLGACGLALYAGVRITLVVGQPTGAVLSPILTVLWLLACTNAFNLVDGLDGLAAGIGLFATITIFAGAVIQHNVPLQFATFPLACALLAFLSYNFNPATVFLGDGGSMLIGFLLGCFGVAWTQKSVTLLGVTAPLMALSVPLLDTTLAICRRFLRRQPIFRADRSHIHHKLLDRGLTPRRVVLVLYGFCGLGAACSLLQTLISSYALALLILVLFIAGIWLSVKYLGYAEFILVGRLVRGSQLQQAVRQHLALDALEASLAAASNAADCWRALSSQYRQFGFNAIRWTVNGQVERDGEFDSHAAWVVRIPLGGANHVELAREFYSPENTNAAVVLLAELIRSGVEGKLNPARDAVLETPES